MAADSRKPRAPAFSIYGRHTERAGDGGPGPADHFSDGAVGALSTSRRGASTRFGTSSRANLHEERRAREIPGPGAHAGAASGALDSKYRSAPRFSMGTSKRDADFAGAGMSPGPGAYGVADSGFDSRRPRSARAKFGTSRRGDEIADRQAREMPGPGAYVASSSMGAAPSFKMGTARRDQDFSRKGLGPGPGAYGAPGSSGVGGRGFDSRRPNSATVRFGTSKRGDKFADRHARDMPGPVRKGAYGSAGTDRTSTHRSAPRVGFGTGKRDAGDRRLDGPGPGAYAPEAGSAGRQSLSTRPNSARPRFGTARRDFDLGSRRDTPGPASYGLTDGMGGRVSQGRMRSAPAFGFGTSQRGERRKDAGPGPAGVMPSGLGLRQADSRRKTAPAFGFGTSARAPRSRDADTPGPGHVGRLGSSLGQRAMTTDTRNAPASSFGTSPRFAKSRGTGTPGPGAFGRPDQRSGPAFTMRGR